MWAVTVAKAAKTLDIRPGRLSGWIRSERYQFDDVQYPYWDADPRRPNDQRLFPREWLAAVADHLGIVPDFADLDKEFAHGG